MHRGPFLQKRAIRRSSRCR